MIKEIEKKCNLDDLVAQRMRRIREDCGYTQVKVAEEVGISVSTYSCIEKAQRSARITVIEKFCEFFGLPLSFLLKGADDLTYQQWLGEWRKKAL